MDEPYIRTDDAKTIIDRILIKGNDFFLLRIYHQVCIVNAPDDVH